MNIQEIVSIFKQYGLDFTPAGIWEWDEHGNKTPIDANRYNFLSWDKYPNDNLAKCFLPSNYLVVDIDNEPVELQDDGFFIPSLKLKLPFSLYTTTSKPGRYHIYYSVSTPMQSMRHFEGSRVDILTQYNIFEGHQVENYSIHTEYKLIQAPNDLLSRMLKDKKITSTPSLAVRSNKQRSVIVKKFINNELHKVKEWNIFFRSVFPREQIPQNKKKITFDDFTPSYSLMNGIAVKLSTTAELDFNEHVIPTIELILAHYDMTLDSKEGKKRWNTIIKGLPQHEAFAPYDPDDDEKTLEQEVLQQMTSYAVFQIISKGAPAYIAIDKLTLRPVEYGGTKIFTDKGIQAVVKDLVPTDETGRPISFNVVSQYLPLIDYTTDPWDPQMFIRDDRNVISLVNKTKFIRDAEPLALNGPQSNIFIRVIESVVHPDYTKLVLAWMAQIAFGKIPPIMYLWIATGELEKGGTGKSWVAYTILSKLLGEQVTAISPKTFDSGFDPTEGCRLLVFEEGKMKDSEWASAYEQMKRLASGGYSKANSKYGQLGSRQIKVALSGASNDYPRIPPSDRRFLCLEPAHIKGTTKPLTIDDQDKLAQIERTGGERLVEQELQEFADHLLYLYDKGFESEIVEALFKEAPETPYRAKWISQSINPVKSIILNLRSPDDLYASIHMDRDNAIDTFRICLEYFINQYHDKIKKVELSWHWFREMARIVASHDDVIYSKAQLSKALTIEFRHGSPWAIEKHKNYLKNKPSMRWAQDMYSFNADDEIIEKYQNLLIRLNDEFGIIDNYVSTINLD